MMINTIHLITGSIITVNSSKASGKEDHRKETRGRENPDQRRREGLRTACCQTSSRKLITREPSRLMITRSATRQIQDIGKLRCFGARHRGTSYLEHIPFVTPCRSPNERGFSIYYINYRLCKIGAR